MTMVACILFLMVCGVLNWGYAYFAGFALLVVGRPVLHRSPVYCNFLLHPNFWLLAAFGLCYGLFCGDGLSGFKYYFAMPLVAYTVGWCAVEQGKRMEQMRTVILAVTFGFALNAVLNLFVNLGHNRYQLVDFWSGQFRAATGSGFLNTFVTAIGASVLMLNRRKGFRLLYMAVLALCVGYMFMLGTRTQVVIMLVVNLTVGLLIARENRGMGGVIKILFGLLGVLLFLLLAIQWNLLGLRSFLEGTNLVYRFLERDGLQTSNSARIEQMMMGLSSLFTHPMGGQKAVLYFHNLWLDINRVAGILPFLFMVAYSVSTWCSMWRVFRNGSIAKELRYLVFSVYLAAMLNFAVEPVLEGLLNFFLAVCVINGTVDLLARQGRWEETTK